MVSSWPASDSSLWSVVRLSFWIFSLVSLQTPILIKISHFSQSSSHPIPVDLPLILTWKEKTFVFALLLMPLLLMSRSYEFFDSKSIAHFPYLINYIHITFLLNHSKNSKPTVCFHRAPALSLLSLFWSFVEEKDNCCSLQPPMYTHRKKQD